MHVLYKLLYKVSYAFLQMFRQWNIMQLLNFSFNNLYMTIKLDYGNINWLKIF